MERSRSEAFEPVLRVHAARRARCPLLGPSYYIWVQGCPRRCPGCFNVGALEFDGAAQEVKSGALVRAWAQGGGGLVLSGGEPFSQAEGLASVCRGVRAVEPDVCILAYTGYRIEELLDPEREDWLALLRMLDVLVDGPYLEAHSVDMPLVGSANQSVVLLSGRVAQTRLAALGRAQLQATLRADGRVELIGTGRAGYSMNDVVSALRESGLVLADSEG